GEGDAGGAQRERAGRSGLRGVGARRDGRADAGLAVVGGADRTRGAAVRRGRAGEPAGEAVADALAAAIGIRRAVGVAAAVDAGLEIGAVGVAGAGRILEGVTGAAQATDDRAGRVVARQDAAAVQAERAVD